MLVQRVHQNLDGDGNLGGLGTEREEGDTGDGGADGSDDPAVDGGGLSHELGGGGVPLLVETSVGGTGYVDLLATRELELALAHRLRHQRKRTGKK